MALAPCVVIGAGGHARVVVGLLERLGESQLVGVIDRTIETVGERIGYSSVIGTYDQLDTLIAQGVRRAYIALGVNQDRQQMVHLCFNRGLSLPKLVHPTAILEPGAQIGEGTIVCAGAVICADTQVGRGCIINTGASIDHETIVGDFSHIAPGARIAGRCNIGGSCFIGIGAVVRDFIQIGSRTTVGAGSVVVCNISNDELVLGIPAKSPKTARR